MRSVSLLQYHLFFSVCSLFTLNSTDSTYYINATGIFIILYIDVTDIFIHSFGVVYFLSLLRMFIIINIKNAPKETVFGIFIFLFLAFLVFSCLLDPLTPFQPLVIYFFILFHAFNSHPLFSTVAWRYLQPPFHQFKNYIFSSLTYLPMKSTYFVTSSLMCSISNYSSLLIIPISCDLYLHAFFFRKLNRSVVSCIVF